MAEPHLTAPTLTEKQIARFWGKVAKGEPGECWLWQACVDRKGYGLVGFTVSKMNSIGYRAHVIARWLETGEWPNGLLTLHTCDTPRCCNPAHLYLGTPARNTQDMMDRKRHRCHTQPENIQRGEELTQSKLTEAKVLAIRQRYAAGGVTLEELGDEFNVTKVCIHHVIIRKTWKHLPVS